MTGSADLVPPASLAGAKKWRRYPAYKDSGIEWLGEIPQHWEVKRLKRGYEVQLGKMLRNEPLSKQDTLEPYIRAANVYWEGIDISDIKEMWFSPGEKKQYEVSKGDLIVCEGGDVGRSAIWDGSITPIYIQNAVHRVRAKDGNLNKFLYYLMYTLKSCGYFELLCDRATLAHLTREKLVRILLPFPPVSEQRAIINYLDRETAKIDALVATKERFIKLLAEKRTALISQAVTKGLDPNVPLKDSGVEWLGEIPEHWEVKKVKYLTGKIGSGKTPKGGSEIYVNEGILFLRSQNVHFNRLCLDDSVYIDQETEAQMASTRVYPNDILLNITGASLGRCNIVPEDFPPANVNQHVCIIRPGKQVNPKFLNFLISSSNVQAQIFSTENGSSREGLNFQQVGNLIVSCPPLSEQDEIVDYLEQEIRKIDALITKTRESIEKLKEYRTALISAAVTGKIDVREEAP